MANRLVLSSNTLIGIAHPVLPRQLLPRTLPLRVDTWQSKEAHRDQSMGGGRSQGRTTG